MNRSYRIFPLGDSALTVEFGNEISVGLNEKAIALSEYLGAHPFRGFVESVPAYATTTVFYDIHQVLSGEYDPTVSAFRTVARKVEHAIASLGTSTRRGFADAVEIPIRVDEDAAPDLTAVAGYARASTGDVIDIFCSRTYRVYMLGFLPGFTYMAAVDERIAMPRRETPRTCVPKGSIGIAGEQTGIYSLDCPGGWQIIGRTDVEMFTPNSARPTALKPGVSVRFVRSK